MSEQTIDPRWIPVERQMPDERIRVYATYGTIVWEDVFYGCASSPRHCQRWTEKLWRETRDESPTLYTPTHWMPHPPLPEAAEAWRVRHLKMTIPSTVL